MRQQFTIYKRKSQRKTTGKNDYSFYVWYADPITWRRLPENRRSIDLLNSQLGNPPKHIKNRQTAIIIAQKALDLGLAFRNSRNQNAGIRFKEYIRKFWNYDESDYVKRKLMEGTKITRLYCSTELKHFEKHCEQLIPDDLPLCGFSVSLMESIKVALFDKGASSSTINHVISSVRLPLSEAYRLDLIQNDVASKLKTIKNSYKEKGITTKEESEKVIKYLKESTIPDTYERWKYLIPALSYYSGMRLGEIQALTADAIKILPSGEGLIRVSQAWNEKDGIKTPKNGKPRATTAPAPLCLELLEYAKGNPEGVIFSSLRAPSHPINKTTINESYCEALVAIGITQEERKNRNITFHSLRHRFNTSLTTTELKESDRLSVMGHGDSDINKIYTHETLESLRKEAETRQKAIPYIE